MLRSLLASITTQATTVPGSYSPSLGDPVGSSVLVAAVQWLEGTLLGTIATTVAVIAVATVGFMAFSGRIDIRRGVTVVLGCFVLFGSSSIVAGIENMIHEDGTPPAPVVRAEVSPLATRPQRPAGYDPYAGAAVPTR